jgi:hypothetical protein
MVENYFVDLLGLIAQKKGKSENGMKENEDRPLKYQINAYHTSPSTEREDNQDKSI